MVVLRLIPGQRTASAGSVFPDDVEAFPVGVAGLVDQFGKHLLGVTAPLI
jgi:hypothetical protein